MNGPTLLEGDHLMRFDVVVANPPFGLDKWGAEKAANDPYKRFTPDVPPKSRGDYAFILHMLASAKPGDNQPPIAAMATPRMPVNKRCEIAVPQTS